MSHRQAAKHKLESEDTTPIKREKEDTGIKQEEKGESQEHDQMSTEELKAAVILEQQNNPDQVECIADFVRHARSRDLLSTCRVVLLGWILGFSVPNKSENANSPFSLTLTDSTATVKIITWDMLKGFTDAIVIGTYVSLFLDKFSIDDAVPQYQIFYSRVHNEVIRLGKQAVITIMPQQFPLPYLIAPNLACMNKECCANFLLEALSIFRRDRKPDYNSANKAKVIEINAIDCYRTPILICLWGNYIHKPFKSKISDAEAVFLLKSHPKVLISLQYAHCGNRTNEGLVLHLGKPGSEDTIAKNNYAIHLHTDIDYGLHLSQFEEMHEKLHVALPINSPTPTTSKTATTDSSSHGEVTLATLNQKMDEMMMLLHDISNRMRK